LNEILRYQIIKQYHLENFYYFFFNLEINSYKNSIKVYSLYDDSLACIASTKLIEIAAKIEKLSENVVSFLPLF